MDDDVSGELQRLMHAGDAAALDQLARACGPRLLAVARRCCRSPHDAEDAVQQALVSASSSMQGYRGDGSPIAWLSTLVARSCFRMNRAAHNDPARTVHTEDVDGWSCADCADPAQQAERRELEREIGDALGAALMTLSRTDRIAFLLAAEGWSSDAIARHFSLTSDAVRSRLKRARKILRERLVTHEDAVAALHGDPPRRSRDEATQRRQLR